jgi:hypothetical protein
MNNLKSMIRTTLSPSNNTVAITDDNSVYEVVLPFSQKDIIMIAEIPIIDIDKLEILEKKRQTQQTALMCIQTCISNSLQASSSIQANNNIYRDSLISYLKSLLTEKDIDPLVIRRSLTACEACDWSNITNLSLLYKSLYQFFTRGFLTPID